MKRFPKSVLLVALLLSPRFLPAQDLSFDTDGLDSYTGSDALYGEYEPSDADVPDYGGLEGNVQGRRRGPRPHHAPGQGGGKSFRGFLLGSSGYDVVAVRLGKGKDGESGGMLMVGSTAYRLGSVTVTPVSSETDEFAGTGTDGVMATISATVDAVDLSSPESSTDDETGDTTGAGGSLLGRIIVKAGPRPPARPAFDSEELLDTTMSADGNDGSRPQGPPPGHGPAVVLEAQLTLPDLTGTVLALEERGPRGRRGKGGHGPRGPRGPRPDEGATSSSYTGGDDL